MNLKPLVVLGLCLALTSVSACDLATGVANMAKCSNIGAGETVTFDDEAFIGNCKISGTLVVKGNSRITGNIIAEAGSTVVLDEAQVLGNVDSDDGASLTIGKSKITGNVNARGTAIVKVTGTTITGNFNVANADTCEVEGNAVTQTAAPDGCVAPAPAPTP